MKNILSVSMCLPYEGVPHAGGKTVNYYLSRFADEEGYSITLVCKVHENEKEKVNTKCNPKFDIYPIEMPTNKINKSFAYATSVWSKINPLNKYGNTLTSYIYSQYFKQLEKLKDRGYKPDIIILEWTEMGLCIEEIKNIFPNAIIYISEHDVKFQAAQRKYLLEKNVVKKIYKKMKYTTMKRNELSSLNKADLVITQSNKDKDILTKYGLPDEKQLVISPFYMRCQSEWTGIGKNCIALYGDMSRPENYESAIWFIENVFSKIEFSEIRLYVIGGRPVEKLKKYSSERVVITGFVDDVFTVFNDCFCLVAPLQMGAGIKVKCLEAISFGIPLIGNEIAMEGIAAEDKREFIYSETVQDYVENIVKLYKNVDYQRFLSTNEIKFSKENLNIESSYNKYYCILEHHLEDKNEK